MDRSTANPDGRSTSDTGVASASGRGLKAFYDREGVGLSSGRRLRGSSR